MIIFQAIAAGIILFLALAILALSFIASRLLWDKWHQVDKHSIRRWIKLRIEAMKGWRR